MSTNASVLYNTPRVTPSDEYGPSEDELYQASLWGSGFSTLAEFEALTREWPVDQATYDQTPVMSLNHQSKFAHGRNDIPDKSGAASSKKPFKESVSVHYKFILLY